MKRNQTELARIFLTASVLLVALVFTGGTSAGSWLAGASAGNAKQHDYEVGGPIATTDDSDSGFRAFGGFMFAPTMGVVGSYVDLGDAYYDGPAFGGFTDTLSADGFDISFLGGWAPGSQEKFSLFGTAGFFIWDQKVTYEDAGTGGPEIYNDSGTSMSIGVGSEISFGKGGKWGVHISFQRFMDVGDNNNSGHEYDRDLASVGVDYRFGK